MDALTQAYQSELKRVRSAVASRAETLWHKLPNYYDDQIPVFLQQVLPVVQAGQFRAIALTSAYSARRLGVAPVGIDTAAIVANVRKGVAPEAVYGRPFITMRAAIRDLGVAGAIEKGASRLLATADMDVAMASRDSLLPLTSELQKTGTDIVAWQRVADPGCCDFCLMLDGVHTGPQEPQPLHNRCGCTAEPITTDRFSFTSVISGAVIGSAMIHEHGELGPLITDKHDNFTSLDDLPSAAQDAYETETSQQFGRRNRSGFPA
jgi:hypothetical protein